MAISYQEPTRLICPSCGARVSADVWLLVDAAERPDLAVSLREGTLNAVVCPQCGHQWLAGVSFLFHDPANRRVYFAVPPNVDEHRWREDAQARLYTLVGSLPEAERRPYLGDVQIEHEIEGVRRAVLRRDRVRGRSGAPAPMPITREPVGEPAPTAPIADDTALFGAVRELLSADSEAEFARVLAQNPALLSEQGDAALRQFADLAYNQGDREIGDALREVRANLARRRSGAPDPAPSAAPSPGPAADEARPSAAAIAQSRLPDTAYQALLQVDSPSELVEVVRDYPALLEAWADTELAMRAELALDEGNERLAQLIEIRREALADLRAQTSDEASLLAGVRALRQASSDEAIAGVLATYPMLLTDAAQEALVGLATVAQSRGDAELAEYAVACGAMLRTIRAGLEAS